MNVEMAIYLLVGIWGVEEIIVIYFAYRLMKKDNGALKGLAISAFSMLMLLALGSVVALLLILKNIYLLYLLNGDLILASMCFYTVLVFLMSRLSNKILNF